MQPTPFSPRRPEAPSHIIANGRARFSSSGSPGGKGGAFSGHSEMRKRAEEKGVALGSHKCSQQQEQNGAFIVEF